MTDENSNCDDARRQPLMPPTKLVIVEGIPGSGKSTTAQFIGMRLRQQGVPARWYHETLKPHPVYTFYDDTRHRTAADYCEEALSRWQAFVAELRGLAQVSILDAALFQNHIRSMLYHDCDRHKIIALVRQIEGLVSDLVPVLLYLRRVNVGSTLRDVCRVRGERLMELWLENHDRFPYAQRDSRKGYVGLTAFWDEFRALSDRLFAELGIHKLKIDTSGSDWCRPYQQICDFLDLPLPTQRQSQECLERFAGEYVHREHPGERGVTLLAGPACLIAQSEGASMRVDEGPFGCFREVRLIPRDRNVFYVAGWPCEVAFVENPAGSVESMRLAATEDGRPRPSEVFVRAR